MHLCYKLSCSLHFVSLDNHGSLVSTGACLPHFSAHTCVCYVHRHTDTHNVHIIIGIRTCVPATHGGCSYKNVKHISFSIVMSSILQVQSTKIINYFRIVICNNLGL